MVEPSGTVTEPPKSGSSRLGRLRSMGGDGLVMLIASSTGIIATAGISLLVCFYHVFAVARRAAAPPVAGAGPVLVPGVCLQPNGRPDPDFIMRLTRAMRFEKADIVILGGATRAGVAISEAAAGRQWLIANGVAAEQVQCEETSRNTLENLRAARRRFVRTGSDPVIVSNRYHLARLGLLARGLGMDPLLCAAEERLTMTPGMVRRLLLEAFFIHWYVVGKTLARLLRHESMLSRVS
ncbi:YdcF family protein [Pacificispira sp.]|uniref:YdcF family protein n=1 Tax=Pacificispira sp. TaxID=2888761 RepID=UPI003BAA9FBA